MKMAVPKVHRRKSNCFRRMLCDFLWWLVSYVEFLFKAGLIYHFSFAIHFLIFFLSFFSRGEFNSPTSNFGNVHPSDVLDMPVDPNEPTYCLCHQVSYGEMIGCDNTEVSFMVPYYHSCSRSMSVIGCCSLCHIHLVFKKFHLMKSGKMLGLPLQKTQRNIFVSVGNLEMI